jgi:putative transposase
MIRIELPRGLRRCGPRESDSGTVYHIRTSTFHGQPTFGDMTSVDALISCLRSLEVGGEVETLAFVILPDHLHWLVRLSGDTCVDAVTRSLKRDSTLAVNRRLGCTRMTVWEPGYIERLLTEPEEIRMVKRYIAANAAHGAVGLPRSGYPIWEPGCP